MDELRVADNTVQVVRMAGRVVSEGLVGFNAKAVRVGEEEVSGGWRTWRTWRGHWVS